MDKIELSKIFADPKQPRQHFDKNELETLKTSIKERGIYVPLLVESNYNGDNYLLLDGERRYRCAKELELTTVPVTILTGPLSIEERAIIRFNVQKQHAQWTMFDEAKAIHDLKNETKLTINELAVKLNLHPSEVHYWISMTDLTDSAQKYSLDNNIPFTSLIYIVRIVKNYLVMSDMQREEIERKVIDKVLAENMGSMDVKKWSNIVSSDEQSKDKINFLCSDMTFKQFCNLISENKNKEIIEVYRNLIDSTKKIISITEIEHSMTQEQKQVVDNLIDRLKEYESLHPIKE